MDSVPCSREWHAGEATIQRARTRPSGPRSAPPGGPENVQSGQRNRGEGWAQRGDGTNISLVFRNLPVMLAWGAMVLVLSVIGIATGFLGLIIIFPLLGHGTWHSYKAIR